MNVGWQNVGNQFVLGEDGGQLVGDNAGGVATSSSDATFLINQKGSGNILQLQSNGVDRFMVSATGMVSILADTATSTDALFTVGTSTSPVFTINARGDAGVAGTIVMKNDTFAGSIATQADGTAEVDFAYDLGTGKPVVELTPEADVPVFAQVYSWKQDTAGNYTGFVMKTFGLNGTTTSAVVHYIVVGKEDGYATSGTVLQVVSAPTGSDTSENIATVAGGSDSTSGTGDTNVGTSTPSMTDTSGSNTATSTDATASLTPDLTTNTPPLPPLPTPAPAVTTDTSTTPPAPVTAPSASTPTPTVSTTDTGSTSPTPTPTPASAQSAVSPTPDAPASVAPAPAVPATTPAPAASSDTAASVTQ